MKPLAHQEKFANNYQGKKLIVHEGGTGKTVCACLWLKDGRDSNALVICPKKVIKKWQKSLSDWGTKAKVVSPNEYKKLPIAYWSGVVVDEADEFASPLFVGKKRSQLSEVLYALVRAFKLEVLLLTATPVRSNPWNLHSLLCFIGEYIDWKSWREHFFYLQKPDNGRFRFLQRAAYFPKENWRQLTRPFLEKYADIVLLKDCVDVPPVTEITIQVETPKYIMQLEDKPFFSEHRWEQQNKAHFILEAGREFRKVLVVAYYREQIENLVTLLGKDKDIFAVHGGTNNQEDILKQAQESDDCYLIVQASLGAGFDADTFSCIVFASMSYAVRDYVQMKFRVRRIHNLHPVEFRYLIGGRCDRGVMENIIKGKDFVPSEWK